MYAQRHTYTGHVVRLHHMCSNTCLRACAFSLEERLSRCARARPISVLRFWISEVLTQAESLFSWVELPGPQRKSPGKFESTNLGREILSRGNFPESSSQQILAGRFLAGDRAQHRGVLLYIQYVYIHVCIYTYIYIYIEREREIGRVRAPGAGPLSPKP